MTTEHDHRFRCYWCKRDLGRRKLHHRQPAAGGDRLCCVSCHSDLDGIYRKVYPGGASQEEREVLSYGIEGVRL